VISLKFKSSINDLRKCPIQNKITYCTGLCKVVYNKSENPSGDDTPILCPELEKALDLALNGD
jgi:hypothetical protein